MTGLYLPPQADWPGFLFRVTSSLTWRRTTSTDCSFVSPVQQLEHPHEISLEAAFPCRSAFDDAVARHLKCSHVIGDGRCFHTPFISTTSSFRYALSVAELHYRRDGDHITIGVMDTTLLKSKTPIWDAEHVSNIIHLGKSKDDFKDEYLVFGSIKASPEGFKCVNYLDLVYRIGSFIPEILDKKETSRSRFATYWKGIPQRTRPYTSVEAAAAFEIARSIATKRTMVPLMINVLLLHESTLGETVIIDEVTEQVCTSSYLTKADFQAYFQFVVSASYSVMGHGSRSPESMNIYDFFGQEHKARESSMTKETRLVTRCMAVLRKKLHDVQAVRIRRHFDLTPTALVVRQFTFGYADLVIKSIDRRASNIDDILRQYQAGTQLAQAYSTLVRSVEKCKLNALSRMNALLRQCKDQAPHLDVSSRCRAESL